MDNSYTVNRSLNLCSLGTSYKLLFTGYLSAIAVGYIMALIQILFTHGMADGKVGLSLDDVVYSYYGNRSGSVLEKKLNGSMKANASEEERFALIQWVRDGGNQEQYLKQIKPIVEARCVMCHNENAGGLPDFNKFEVLSTYAESDHGATFASLTRISHIHLFGISFIFMFVGLIFGLSTGINKKWKYFAIVMPYLFLLLDISSWWLTKLNSHFALLVVIGGAGLGVAFAFMWTASIYQMWFMECKLGHPDRRNAVYRK